MPDGTTLKKVLVANRGEIAVRVIRACQDADIQSVAVYAEPDADAPFVRAAGEAFALGGQTAAESYLDIDKILDAARRSGADAIHPGYGFLSENAEFAQAVQDAGLVWIGPNPQAIRDLGDKVTARHLAQRAGAPLVPGTKDPVSGSDEVLAFADEHGLPVAIKAASGGGGRGLKVARTREEIPELYESAYREAAAAFGRGDCFVERYLDRPRHVEAQVLADQHGTVVVVGTRDCSLQRRHQKLVEEAPAPFLTEQQRERIHTASRAICAEAGYHGAGTVEFLVGADGTISFLEVNTRLQVEHPVSEETTGLDLVREQFRIAEGGRLPLTGDPEPVGHAIEFRINGEDPGRDFLPTPGVVTRLRTPSGPGVRVDNGIDEGSTIGGNFDSMLGKLIVTGADRAQALQRARRALDEMVVDGIPTVVPFHRHVVRDPAFTATTGADFLVHTRWIETEFAGTIDPAPLPDQPAESEQDGREVVVEVGGRRLEVKLPADFAATPAPPAQRAKPARKKRNSGGDRPSGDAVTAPMQGTVVKVAVEDGQEVAEGDLVVVLEAMKMENSLTAHKSGTITGLTAAPGDAITPGTTLCSIT